MPRPKANYMAPFQDAQRRKRERVLAGDRAVRRFSALMIALHVVAFCLTLQLSGIAHLVIDLWLMGDAAALHAHGPSDSKDDGEDCPDEGCPPGCPSCHCTHTVPMLPALGEAPLLVELPKLVHEILLAYEMRGPPSPDGLSIYRPPRFQRVSYRATAESVASVRRRHRTMYGSFAFPSHASLVTPCRAPS